MRALYFSDKFKAQNAICTCTLCTVQCADIGFVHKVFTMLLLYMRGGKALSPEPQPDTIWKQSIATDVYWFSKIYNKY